MRLALILMIAWGLIPGLREMTESAVHFVRTGHAHAHHAPGSDTDLGDEAPEHSCGASMHHCGCCSSQPLASGRVLAVAPATDAAARPVASLVLPPTYLAIERPFRPPIA